MKITADDHRLLDAAVFYAKVLGISKKPCTLDVCWFDPDAENIGAGWIEYGEHDATIYISTTDNPQEDAMDILAHEMVHLKQYVTGQMVDIKGMNVVIWEGTAYDTTNDPTDWRYWNSPWELEAFGRSQGLNYMRQHEEKKNEEA